MPDTLADLILYNGRLHTVDRKKPQASAVAIKDGRFVVVGSDAQAMALQAGHASRRPAWSYGDSRAQRLTLAPDPWRSQLQPRTALEGVPSPVDASAHVKDQADRTPTPQWVRWWVAGTNSSLPKTPADPR
jgi:predicted amidohydrolase YtcJ